METNKKPKIIAELCIFQLTKDGCLTQEIMSELQKKEFWTDAFIDQDEKKAVFIRAVEVDKVRV